MELKLNNFKAEITFIFIKKIQYHSITEHEKVLIDTGATKLFIPLEFFEKFDLKFTKKKFIEDCSKNNKIKIYGTAKGNDKNQKNIEKIPIKGIKVYEKVQEYRFNIDKIGYKTLNFYFYDGEKILFGLEELIKYFKFCVGESEDRFILEVKNVRRKL